MEIVCYESEEEVLAVKQPVITIGTRSEASAGGDSTRAAAMQLQMDVGNLSTSSSRRCGDPQAR